MGQGRVIVHQLGGQDLTLLVVASNLGRNLTNLRSSYSDSVVRITIMRKTKSRPYWRYLAIGLLALGILLLVTWVCLLLFLNPELTGFGETPSFSVDITDAEGNRTNAQITQLSRSFWDWLELLIVPGTLALLGIAFQFLQQWQLRKSAKAQRLIAEEREREDALQVYLDRLSVLLVDKNFFAKAHNSQHNYLSNEWGILEAATSVINARTLSIIRRFEDDAGRKSSVIRFLIDTEIIRKANINISYIDLSKVDLRGTDLSEISLNGIKFDEADLREVNFRKSDLTGASFKDANLSLANLSSANLSSSNFSGANLNSADLRNVNLSNANFSETDLEEANLNKSQFENTKFVKANLKGASIIGVRINRSDFDYSNLTNVALRNSLIKKTQLNSANLFNIDLRGTLIKETSFYYTDLSKAKISMRYFDGALLCRTKLPEASKNQVEDPNRDCINIGVKINPINSLIRFYMKGRWHWRRTGTRLRK